MAMFHLRCSSDGQFFFDLYSRAGPRLLRSQPFATKDLAAQAIDACRHAAAFDSRYRRRESDRKRLCFDLIALTDTLIGTSEEFDSEKERERVIQYCRSRVPLAGAADDTLPIRSA